MHLCDIANKGLIRGRPFRVFAALGLFFITLLSPVFATVDYPQSKSSLSLSSNPPLCKIQISGQVSKEVCEHIALNCKSVSEATVYLRKFYANFIVQLKEGCLSVVILEDRRDDEQIAAARWRKIDEIACLISHSPGVALNVLQNAPCDKYDEGHISLWSLLMKYPDSIVALLDEDFSRAADLIIYKCINEDNPWEGTINTAGLIVILNKHNVSHANALIKELGKLPSEDLLRYLKVLKEKIRDNSRFYNIKRIEKTVRRMLRMLKDAGGSSPLAGTSSSPEGDDNKIETRQFLAGTERVPVTLRLTIYESKKSNPVIIFLPGSMAYSEFYSGMLIRLQQSGYNVIGVDYRGHGRSTGIRGDFTIEELVEDINKIVDYAIKEFNANIAILGTSLGGILALYSAAADTRIKSVICHNACILQEDALKISRYPVLSKIFSLFIGPLSGIFPRLRLPVSWFIDLNRIFEDKDLLKRSRQDPLIVTKYSIRAIKSLFTAEPGDISVIKTPIMLICGRDDQVVPLVYAQKIYDILRKRPGCQTELRIVNNAGHMLFIEHIEETMKVIKVWLKEIFGKGSSPLEPVSSRPGGVKIIRFYFAASSTLGSTNLQNSLGRIDFAWMNTTFPPSFRIFLANPILALVSSGLESTRNTNSLSGGNFLLIPGLAITNRENSDANSLLRPNNSFSVILSLRNEFLSVQFPVIFDIFFGEDKRFIIILQEKRSFVYFSAGMDKIPVSKAVRGIIADYGMPVVPKTHLQLDAKIYYFAFIMRMFMSSSAVAVQARDKLFGSYVHSDANIPFSSGFVNNGINKVKRYGSIYGGNPLVRLAAGPTRPAGRWIGASSSPAGTRRWDLSGMRMTMLPVNNNTGCYRQSNEKAKDYKQKVCSLHYLSPWSIASPVISRAKNDSNPAISRPILKPEIKGPMINVATHILDMSSRVLERFSSWRLVNFIGLNISKYRYIVNESIGLTPASPLTSIAERLSGASSSPAGKGLGLASSGLIAVVLDVLVEFAKNCRMFILIKALDIDWLGIAEYAQRKLRTIGDRACLPILRAGKYSLSHRIRGNALLPLVHIGISILGPLKDGLFYDLLGALRDRHSAVREKAADCIVCFIHNDFRTRPRKAVQILKEELDKYAEEGEDAIIIRLRMTVKEDEKEKTVKSSAGDLLPKEDARPFVWLIHIDCEACVSTLALRRVFPKLELGVKQLMESMEVKAHIKIRSEKDYCPWNCHKIGNVYLYKLFDEPKYELKTANIKTLIKALAGRKAVESSDNPTLTDLLEAIKKATLNDDYLQRLEVLGLAQEIIREKLAPDGSNVSNLLERIKKMIENHKQTSSPAQDETDSLYRCKVGGSLKGWSPDKFVLVVENNNKQRRRLKKILKELGLKAVSAHNGSQAWDIFKNEWESILLVITDLDMPRLDGEGFIRRVRGYRVRKHPPASRVKIMVISRRGFNKNKSGTEIDHYELKPKLTSSLLKEIIVKRFKLSSSALTLSARVVYFTNRQGISYGCCVRTGAKTQGITGWGNFMEALGFNAEGVCPAVNEIYIRVFGVAGTVLFSNFRLIFCRGPP